MFGVSPSTGYAAELAALLKPLVQRSGLDAVWVDSSPSGGDPVIRVDTGIAQYFGVGAYLRDLPDARHSQVKFAAECLAFSNLTDPVVPGGVPRGQRRGLGLRRRAGALPARAVRHGRDRGRRAAGHGRGDGRRVRGVAPPGVRLRRRHRALAPRRRPRRRLGAARPRGPTEAGRPRPRADPAAEPRSGSWTRGSTVSTFTSRNDGPEPLEGTLTVGLLREDGSTGRVGRVRARGPGARAPRGRGRSAARPVRRRGVCLPLRSDPQHAGVRARLVTGSGVEREVVWRVALASLG